MKVSEIAKLQFFAGSENAIDTERRAADYESTTNNSQERVGQQPDTATQKKPYSKPTLTVYGTIRDLTRAVNNMGGDDGGTSPRNKTGFA
jgi:hypothetical protein